jgi:hypothetical protein
MTLHFAKHRINRRLLQCVVVFALSTTFNSVSSAQNPGQTLSLEDQRPKDIPMWLFNMSRHFEHLFYYSKLPTKSFVVESNPYLEQILRSAAVDSSIKRKVPECKTYRITCVSEDSVATNNNQEFSLRVIVFSSDTLASWFSTQKVASVRCAHGETQFNSFFQLDDCIYEFIYTSMNFEKKSKLDITNAIKSCSGKRLRKQTLQRFTLPRSGC